MKYRTYPAQVDRRLHFVSRHRRDRWISSLKGVMSVLFLVWLTGCSSTRSISNPRPVESGVAGSRMAEGADPGFEYRGELNEFDVLGVDRNRFISDEEIAKALDAALTVNLVENSRVLLVQSGAVLPDGAMVQSMEKHFDIVPFSGVPVNQRTATNSEPGESTSYGRALRLAAARAGAKVIVCYWGTLESGRRKLETKTISWVPIAGWMVPDESQSMRIRLKVAMVDVRTGAWRVVTPEPYVDTALSTSFSRGSSDRRQIESLKSKAYDASVKKLLADSRSAKAIQ